MGIVRYLLGPDVFISYSRADGLEYARAIAGALSARSISCYVDQWEASSGTTSQAPTIRALKRTFSLVVIATPGSAKSTHVQREIETYAQKGKTILVVGNEPVAHNALWGNAIRGLPITEDDDGLRTGSPSPNVIDRIDRSIAYRRQNSRIRRSLGFGIAITVCLAIGSAVSVFSAVDQRTTAKSQSIAAAARAVSVTDPSLAYELALIALEKKRNRETESTFHNIASAAAPLIGLKTPPVKDVAVSWGRKELISAHDDGPALIWDLNTGKRKDSLSPPPRRIASLTSPTIEGETPCTRTDPFTPKAPSPDFESPTVSALNILKDDKSLLLGFDSGAWMEVDLDKRQLVSCATDAENGISELNIAKNGALVIRGDSGRRGGSVTVYDRKTGTRSEHYFRCQGLDFDGFCDTNDFIVSNNTNHIGLFFLQSLYMFDPLTAIPAGKVEYKDFYVVDAAFFEESSGEEKLVTMSVRSTKDKTSIDIWKFGKANELKRDRSAQLAGNFRRFILSPNRKFMLVEQMADTWAPNIGKIWAPNLGVQNPEKLSLVDFKSLKPIGSWPNISFIEFADEEGKRLLVKTASDELALVDVDTKALQRLSIRVSPEAKFIYDPRSAGLIVWSEAVVEERPIQYYSLAFFRSNWIIKSHLTDEVLVSPKRDFVLLRSENTVRLYGSKDLRSEPVQQSQDVNALTENTLNDAIASYTDTDGKLHLIFDAKNDVTINGAESVFAGLRGCDPRLDRTATKLIFSKDCGSSEFDVGLTLPVGEFPVRTVRTILQTNPSFYMSRNGEWIIVKSRNKPWQIRSLKTSTSSELAPYEAGIVPLSIAVSPDERWAVIVQEFELYGKHIRDVFSDEFFSKKSVLIADLTKKNIVYKRYFPRDFQDTILPLWTPNSSSVAIGYGDRLIEIFDTVTSSVRSQLRSPEKQQLLSMSRDGVFLLSAGQRNLSIWNLPQGVLVGSIPIPDLWFLETIKKEQSEKKDALMKEEDVFSERRVRRAEFSSSKSQIVFVGRRYISVLPCDMCRDINALLASAKQRPRQELGKQERTQYFID